MVLNGSPRPQSNLNAHSGICSVFGVPTSPGICVLKFKMEFYPGNHDKRLLLSTLYAFYLATIERVWLAGLERNILYIQSYYTTTHNIIQGCEGQTILNGELSECAVIRLSPEHLQREDEDQDGGVALLRSRVEQQSTLIAMLKQRGDETLREVSVIQGLA